MLARLEQTIYKLRSSPLFYLFLGSRELFHTNFWYWLSTLNPKEAAKLFSNDGALEIEALNYKREHNQSVGVEKSKVDLLVSDRTGRPLLVVENKVKDFPTYSQLNRIRKSFENASIEFVLTTLFHSPDVTFEGWKIRTYRDIGEVIIPSKFSDNEYYQALIQDYKEFCSNLAELAETLPLSNAYDFTITLNKELFNTLNEIKLWEGYQKLRASHLLYHFNNRNGIETSYLINNQKATINFHFPIRDNYELLVALEDVQFRRFAAGKNPQPFAENLLSRKIFFSESFSGRGGKPFLKYDNPGDKKYRYQYERVTTAIPFDELFDRICRVMGEIAIRKSEIEDCLPKE